MADLGLALGVAGEWLRWGEHDRAERVYLVLRERAPANPWVLLGLATVQRQGRGDVDAARTLLQRIEWRSSPGPRPMHRALADEWLEVGGLDEAETIGRWARERTASATWPSVLLACVEAERALRANRIEDAVAQMLRLDVLPIDEAPRILRFVDALGRAGRHGLEFELVQRLVALAPGHLPLRMREIGLRRHRGEPAAALRAFESLAEEFPTKAAPAHQAAVTASVLGLGPRALGHFREALRREPTAVARAGLVGEALAGGHLEDARAELSTSADAGEDETASMLRLRVMLARIDADEAAAEHAMQLSLACSSRPAEVASVFRAAYELDFDRVADAVLDGAHAARTALASEVDALRIQADLRRRDRASAVSRLRTFEGCAQTTLDRLRCAEAWVAVGRPTRARSQAREIAATLPVSGPLHRSELERALALLRTLGEESLEEATFARLEPRIRGDFPSLLASRAARLEARTRPPAHVPASLRASLDDAEASVDDGRALVRALLDAEDVVGAHEALDRFDSRHRIADLLPLRVEALTHDLEFDAALELLREAALRHPLDPRLARELSMLLLTLGSLDEAEAVIETWHGRLPTQLPWVAMKLRLALRRHGSIGPWIETYRALAPHLGTFERVILGPEYVTGLMRSHDHERALATAFHVRHLLDRLPMAPEVRTDQRLALAHRFIYLARPNEAAVLLATVARENASPRIASRRTRMAMTLEPFAGRDAHAIAALSETLPLARHRLRLTEFGTHAPVAPNAAPRIVVLLHLFYQEAWDELWASLRHLRGFGARIHVSVSRALDAGILDALRDLDPDVTVRQVENRGFDVGAHWQALDAIDLASFDIALLLQEKRSRQMRVGDAWRNNLFEALLGSPEVLAENLGAFRDPRVGMIGSGLHRNAFDDWHFPKMRRVLEALDLPTRFESVAPLYEHVSGTVFMVRADLLAEMHRKTRASIAFEPYSTLSAFEKVDRSLAHAMERAFGVYVNHRGYGILYRPAPPRAHGSP